MSADRAGSAFAPKVRCECEIQIRIHATIQGIGQFRNGRCLKPGKVTLRAGQSERLFCTAHARMAQEGLIDAHGHVMGDTDRANVRAGKVRPIYAGTWWPVEEKK